MVKLEFIPNTVNKLTCEWPTGTVLRQIEETKGVRRILNTNVVVKEYLQYCRGNICSYCCSNGRILAGDKLFCIGHDEKNRGRITYWEEDK